MHEIFCFYFDVCKKNFGFVYMDWLKCMNYIGTETFLSIVILKLFNWNLNLNWTYLEVEESLWSKDIMHLWIAAMSWFCFLFPLLVMFITNIIFELSTWKLNLTLTTLKVQKTSWLKDITKCTNTGMIGFVFQSIWVL